MSNRSEKQLPVLFPYTSSTSVSRTTLVFPLAARLLSSSEKAAIAEEMAARRKVKMITANGRRA